jgi:hypothetical protein
MDEGDPGDELELREVGRGGVGVLAFCLLFGEGGVRDKWSEVGDVWGVEVVVVVVVVVVVEVETVDAGVAAEDLLTRRGELLTVGVEVEDEEVRGEAEGFGGCSFGSPAPG